MRAVIFSENDSNFNLAESLKILNKPVLDYQLDYLRNSNCVDAIILINSHISNEFYQNNIRHVFIKSSGGGLDLNKLIPYLDDRPFLLIVGNVLINFTLSTLKYIHKSTRADLSLLYSADDQRSGYYLKLDDLTRTIKDIQLDQKEYKYLSNNVFMINPELLTYDPEANRLFFEKFIPTLLEKNKKVLGIQNTDFWSILNTPEEYYKTNFAVLNSEMYKIAGNKINTSYYGNKCEIEFSVQLLGKQFFGNNCLVAEKCLLKDNIIGNDISIGTNCRIQNCIIQNSVKIGDNCEILNSVIGEGVQIDNNVRLHSNTILAKGSIIKQYSGVLNVQR